MAKPREVACSALQAAERGAKVLVVRNTVRDAVATARALHEVAPYHSALFRLDGVATLHHGRFARSDRWRLDHAVEDSIGKTRTEGPLILIGTQTLEQSLDIDSDLLITDLAPIDVLLQRIGRLHRHARRRPAGVESPRAIVLTPVDFDALLATVGQERMSGPHGLGSVYDNLISLAATKEMIGSGALWTIPAMNRALVEAGTHSEALDCLATRLARTDERWKFACERLYGKHGAQKQAADFAKIEWDAPVSGFRIAEEHIGTRLGLGDIEIEFPAPLKGPFPNSDAITRLVIPAHWLKGTGYDARPVDIVVAEGSFSFRLNGHMFSYAQYGLERH